MTTIAGRIVAAHDGLTSKLAELRRREAVVRDRLSPLRHLASPWLYLAVAGLAGYRLGGSRARRGLLLPGPAPAAGDSLALTVVRASVVAVAQALVRHAVASLLESDHGA